MIIDKAEVIVTSPDRNFVTLKLTTDDGLSGLGDATLNGRELAVVAYLREHVVPLLIGRDASSIEDTWQFLYRSAYWRRGPVTMAAIAAVDVALWDLVGKAMGQPIHRLLGTFRESVPAYASSAVLPSAAAYAEQAVEFKEYGWAAYKIHPPTRWQEDIKVCEAVRRAVGDYTIMLDSTWAYDFPAALRVGRAVQEMNYFWYEDPLHDQDIYNYVKLKQQLSIPILATEYPITGLESYQPWIMNQATDYLRGDVAVKGGITTLVKTAHLAEAFRMTYEVHHGGNSLNNVANLHVIAAIRNTTFFEVLLPDGAQKYGLELDIAVGRDGMVHVPNGPGLGAVIDFKLIQRKKMAVLS